MWIGVFCFFFLLNAFHNEAWITGVQTHKYICFIGERFSVVHKWRSILYEAFCIRYSSIQSERRCICLTSRYFATRIPRYGIWFWEMSFISSIQKWCNCSGWESQLSLHWNAFLLLQSQMSIWCSFTASRITCLVRTRWNDTFTSLRVVFSKHLWISHGFPCRAKSVKVSEISNFSLNIRKTWTKKAHRHSGSQYDFK